MALTVRDIMELPSGRKMRLIAGEKGMDSPVVTVEIADYEFAPDLRFVPGVEFDISENLNPASFIVTSFLFARDDSSVILSAIKTMKEMGAAALAFKQIIYDELPEEVLDFANKNNFPILAFGRDVWFENIIFDIMYAVQFDDKVYFSEEKIDAMLSGRMNRSELDIILKGISLKLRPYISVVYISGESLDAGRILRSFYLLKGFQGKGLMIRYGDSLFLIITSALGDHKSHEIIRQEAFGLLGIVGEVSVGMSDIHEKTALDKAFRESMQCFIASAVEGKVFDHFAGTGFYRALLPAAGNEESTAFAKDILGAFADNPDLWETSNEYVKAGGDITKAADSLHCHQNTIRYRLRRIRELTGMREVTDSELYLQLKTALVIDRAASLVRE